MNWQDANLEPLFEAIRERGPAADAERSVWAFERALGVARIEPGLVEYVLVACLCLRAYEEGETPRTILERVFRRAVDDAEWQARFAALLA